jgi:beta-lactamase class A
MAGNLRCFVPGNVLSTGSREHLSEWLVDCKTGGWASVDLVQGGSPTPRQFEAVFAEVGRMVGRQLG